MKCPSCEFEIGNKKVCKECGYDLKVYDKAKKISNVLYNKGLSLITNGCISQGITMLEKSLECNKRNIIARNLLGLSHMYLGNVGDSLKQWIISAHMCKEENIANEYIEIAQKNKGKLAKYDEAIVMYNEALTYMRDRNEDMSIIRLKKAIYLSENFLEAYKLLILCYIVQGNYEKAMETIDKATKIDYNNESLINYYRILNPDSTIEKQNIAGEKQKIQKIYMKPRQTPGINKKRLMVSLSMLAGVVFVSGLITFFAFDFLFSSEVKRVREENTQYVKRAADDAEKFKQLSFDLNAAKERINTLEQEKSGLDQTKVLSQANEFYTSGNVEQAALKIKLVDKTALTLDETKDYNKIYNATVPIVAKNYYDKGKKKYDSSAFDDALPNFEKSIYYSSIEKFSPDAYYYAGLIYEKRNEKEKVIEYMDKVIKNYPESDKYVKAVAERAKFK